MPPTEMNTRSGSCNRQFLHNIDYCKRSPISTAYEINWNKTELHRGCHENTRAHHSLFRTRVQLHRRAVSYIHTVLPFHAPVPCAHVVRPFRTSASYNRAISTHCASTPYTRIVLGFNLICALAAESTMPSIVALSQVLQA